MYNPPADLYPFESHWLDLQACRMHYLDEGPEDAPPVLMLHGNPTWSFYYRNLVLALRERYRCIVPDHVGCGLSEKPDDSQYPYSLEQRVADIQALYRHLGIDQPLTLVVHDWGGMIGFAWATPRDALVSRTVILNTAAFPMPPEKRFPLALWLAGRTRLGAFLVLAFNAFSGIASRVAFKKAVPVEIRKAYTGPYDSWANRIATLRFVQDIPLDAADDAYHVLAATHSRLARFADKPGMIAWGERDFVFDEPFLQEWQRILPRAGVHRYPDCGHYVLEDAGDDLIGKIVQFMDQTEHGLEQH